MDKVFEEGAIITAVGDRLRALVFRPESGQISALALGPGVEFPDFSRIADQGTGQLVADAMAAWEEQARAIRRFVGLPEA